MMKVIFQGMESATHRETLLSIVELFDSPPSLVGSWSFMGLKNRRRSQSAIKEDVEGFAPMKVLEGGAHNAPLSRVEALKARDEYYRLIDAVQFDLVVQFDHPTLQDDEWMPDDPRIIPVRHAPTHLEADAVLEAHGSLAMPFKEAGDLLVPVLRRQAKSAIVLGLGTADLAAAATNGFNAVLLSSWFAPGKYGEISAWDGGRFVRANSVERDRVLKRMRGPLERQGFDVELLERKDARESDRLAAYSLLRWSGSLSERSDPSTDPSQGSLHPAVPASGPSPEKPERRVRPTVPLPGFHHEEQPSFEETEDGMEMRHRRTVRMSHESIRSCNTCFISSTCPAFEEHSSCAFSFPVEVRTEEQTKALLSGMVELQATRIAFARFAEEMNGGYPDPAVGTEMDRLFRMTEKMARREQRRERLTFSVEAESNGAPAAGGVLSQIFGRQSDQTRIEPPPQEPMIEAQVIEERSDTDLPDVGEGNSTR